MDKYETLLEVQAGRITVQVQFSGKLTKSGAKQAAIRAFGHAQGVTVTDMRDGTCYRFTASGGRKVQLDPESWMDLN